WSAKDVQVTPVLSADFGADERLQIYCGGNHAIDRPGWSGADLISTNPIMRSHFREEHLARQAEVRKLAGATSAYNHTNKIPCQATPASSRSGPAPSLLLSPSVR